MADSDLSHYPEHVGYVIGRLDRVLRKELTKRLQPLGLSWPAYTVLTFLDRDPGISGADLARRALVSPQAINEVIATLAERKSIERTVDPGHGRILQMHVTDSGYELLAAARAEVEGVESRLLAGVSSAERRDLLDLLHTVAENVGAGLPASRRSSIS